MMEKGNVKMVMAKSAAAKLAIKKFAVVRSFWNRQMTTIVIPFPISDKTPGKMMHETEVYLKIDTLYAIIQ